MSGIELFQGVINPFTRISFKVPTSFRPPPLDQPLGDQSNHAQASAGPTLSPDLGDSNIPIRKYKGQILRTEIGRVEDPEFLDLVTQ